MSALRVKPGLKRHCFSLLFAMAPQTGFEPATGHLFVPCYLQAVGVGLPTAMSWARLALVPTKELALISALLLAASPTAAQLATSSRVQQLNGQSVQSTPTVAPTTGVFCIEEMTATFCNVVTGPNTSGYGSLEQ